MFIISLFTKLMTTEYEGPFGRALPSQVFDEKGVADATARIVSAGIADEQEIASTCCYATQDKIWSSDPQGLRWEWYRVLDDSETFFGHGDGVPVEATPSACCT